MLSQLKEGSIDVAVALTEGVVVKAINHLLEFEKASAANPFQIVQSYTNSPLNWSIAVSPTSSFESVKQLKRIGISRHGSGSHIMACVLANELGISFEFVTCGDISSLIKSVQENTTDAFMWEVITTKPYYDQGVVKMLDTFSAPWPSFVMVSCRGDEFANQIAQLSKKLQESISKFSQEFNSIGKDYILNKRKDVFHYHSPEDLDTWFSQVNYSSNLSQISQASIQKCIDILIQAGLVDSGKIKTFEEEHGSIIPKICNSFLVKLV
jgi:hypothetical protein